MLRPKCINSVFNQVVAVIHRIFYFIRGSLNEKLGILRRFSLCNVQYFMYNGFNGVLFLYLTLSIVLKQKHFCIFLLYYMLFYRLNPSILYRVLFAGARNGHFPSIFGTLQIKFLTPWASILAIVSICLLKGDNSLHHSWHLAL